MAINENQIFVPKGNLKIPRRNMPQVDEKNFGDFFKWLRTEGIQVRRVRVPGAKLKPIQKEISQQAVQQLAKSNSPKLKKPFLISKDGFILDGHHRWLAMLQIDRKVTVEAFQVGLKARDAMDVLRAYPRVLFKDKNNAEYNRPDPNMKLENADMPMTEQERLIAELNEWMKGIDPSCMDGMEYALLIKEALQDMLGDTTGVEDPESYGSFKNFVTEARKDKFGDPKMRVQVRGFGMVRIGDLTKMAESRWKEMDKFRKNGDWRSVRALINNGALLPLLDVLKEIQDANE